jgi:hypothetical protein
MTMSVGRGGASDYCTDPHRPSVFVHGKEDPIGTHAASLTAASALQLDNIAGERIDGHRLNGSCDLHLIFSGKPCDRLLGGPCDGDCPGH